MNETHNPDVLSCLANLSNDEVFTPPSVVNQMLDMLPEELFQSSKTTFLDIGCKSGVFLREITKRLIAGLADEMPDLQTRVDHILHKQVFGIATTELTSLVSRRTLYCSKYPNCRYSASPFETVEGNIRFRNIPHTFVNGRCKWCGASEDQFGDAKRKGLETHAYEFIHTDHPEEIFKMKFDVIVGNPPYQLTTSGGSAQAIPLYDKFVLQAMKLQPKFLTMIIPARWYAGGMGLEDFRMKMLNDSRIRQIVDYPNAKDCFPGNSIGGGVCYFLWNRDNRGTCLFTNVSIAGQDVMRRDLAEFPVFVRYNKAVEIIRKVMKRSEDSIEKIVSSLAPFGIDSAVRGKDRHFNGAYRLLSSKGFGYLSKSEIPKGDDYLGKWKLAVSKVTAEHAGEPDKEGKFKVITRLVVLSKNDVCTFSYFLIGASKSMQEIENIRSYLTTKFARFLVLQAVSSINLSKEKFHFVPMQDFTKVWTDCDLYEKYDLTKDEIAFIDSMIRPME